MVSPPSSALSATAFLYKLCGTSQPSILQGSDGEYYVVKFNGFPGSQSLMNEFLGATLIGELGLPTPKWSPIEVSSTFIDENPRLWFWSEDAPIRPVPGLHFASRLIQAPDEQRTYQMIPHSWIGRIENRADFLGVLVLDLWANNCDRRQAVFLGDGTDQLRASFIDNDFMFGGKFGNDTTSPRRAMIYDLGVYQGLWHPKTVQQWLRKIEDFGADAIRRIVENVPDEWTDQYTRDKIVDQLAQRRAMLPSLLNEAEEVIRSGYSVEYHRSRNATEPSQIHVAPVFSVPR